MSEAERNSVPVVYRSQGAKMVKQSKEEVLRNLSEKMKKAKVDKLDVEAVKDLLNGDDRFEAISEVGSDSIGLFGVIREVCVLTLRNDRLCVLYEEGENRDSFSSGLGAAAVVSSLYDAVLFVFKDGSAQRSVYAGGQKAHQDKTSVEADFVATLWNAQNVRLEVV